MSVFTIRISDRNIGISAVYDYTEKMCKDYLTDNAPDLEIVITQADIDFERHKSEYNDIKEGHEIRNFADDYLESLAVYRKIIDHLTDDNVILFHGSCVAVDGVGYLFTAKSGTGKSTHTRLWREVFGDRAVMINDDKPLIRITDSGVIVYGTPWDGKHRISTNISVPLKAVCILNRANGGENEIREITKREAYPLMLQQTYWSENPLILAKTMQLADRLTSNAGLYSMKCNIDKNAVTIAYERIK